MDEAGFALFNTMSLLQPKEGIVTFRATLAMATIALSAANSLAQEQDYITVSSARFGKGRVIDVLSDIKDQCDNQRFCDIYIDGRFPTYVASGVMDPYTKTLIVEYNCLHTTKGAANIEFEHMRLRCP
jgi:hypothetical protein